MLHLKCKEKILENSNRRASVLCKSSRQWNRNAWWDALENLLLKTTSKIIRSAPAKFLWGVCTLAIREIQSGEVQCLCGWQRKWFEISRHIPCNIINTTFILIWTSSALDHKGSSKRIQKKMQIGLRGNILFIEGSFICFYEFCCNASNSWLFHPSCYWWILLFQSFPAFWNLGIPPPLWY